MKKIWPFFLLLSMISGCHLIFDTPEDTAKKFITAGLEGNDAKLDDLFVGGKADPDAQDLLDLFASWPNQKRIRWEVVNVEEDGEQKIVDLEVQLPITENKNATVTLSFWMKQVRFSWRIDYFEGYNDVLRVQSRKLKL